MKNEIHTERTPGVSGEFRRERAGSAGLFQKPSILGPKPKVFWAPDNIWLWAVLGVVLVVVITVAGGLWSQQAEHDTQLVADDIVHACRDFQEGTLQIGDQEYRVAIADTDAEKTQGLIGCAEVPENSGMYFVYDTPRSAQYWMRGMTIPIDIVWIANGQVVGVEENVPPQPVDAENLPRYQAGVPIDGVLEVGAHKARDYGITEGAVVTFIPS